MSICAPMCAQLLLLPPSSLCHRYDAVTTQGALTWQNSLTSLNQPFFDASDALFVNYA